MDAITVRVVDLDVDFVGDISSVGDTTAELNPDVRWLKYKPKLLTIPNELTELNLPEGWHICPDDRGHMGVTNGEEWIEIRYSGSYKPLYQATVPPSPD